MGVESSERSEYVVATEVMFGLMNSEGFYLTSEKFGNQVSVTGISLRYKQIWHFESNESLHMKGYLKSPFQNYLESDKNGVITCDKDTKSENHLFEVEFTDEGKWMFKDCYGKYLTGTNKNIRCQLKDKAGINATWAIHITNHPQCNIKNVARKRYVHLSDDEFRADEDFPWGKDYVITVEYHQGKYVFRDLNGRYLNGVTGFLDDKCSDDTLFSIFLNGIWYGFKCSNKKYLTVQGSKGRLIASKETFGKDEQFLFEESKPQCFFTANNGRKLTVKQGVDVTANIFEEPGASEIFQIEYQTDKSDVISIFSNVKTYLCATDKSIVTKPELSMSSYFQIEWHGQNISLKANNGKYVTSTSGGKLSPTSDNNRDENSLFTIQLVNRPILVLRCEYGYVGLSSSTPKVVCNRGVGSALHVLAENGKYRFKLADGKSWKVREPDFIVVADEAEGDLFICQLHIKSKMVISAPNGKYLCSDNNGNICAAEDEIKPITFWEY